MKNGKKITAVATLGAIGIYHGFKATLSNPEVWKFFEKISPYKDRISVENTAVITILPVVGITTVGIYYGLKYLKNYLKN